MTARRSCNHQIVVAKTAYAISAVDAAARSDVGGLVQKPTWTALLKVDCCGDRHNHLCQRPDGKVTTTKRFWVAQATRSSPR
jgi:hypothetical protein